MSRSIRFSWPQLETPPPPPAPFEPDPVIPVDPDGVQRITEDVDVYLDPFRAGTYRVPFWIMSRSYQQTIDVGGSTELIPVSRTDVFVNGQPLFEPYEHQTGLFVDAKWRGSFSNGSARAAFEIFGRLTFVKFFPDTSFPMTVRREIYDNDGSGQLELRSVITSNLRFIPTLAPPDVDAGGGGGGGGGDGDDTSDPCTAERGDTPFVTERVPVEEVFD